mmetsp:Transcript_1290/g.1612  ORF Transcript_1290/g.1612 Transcript_1290/m.1612 type:complete len:103 (-) Transcript_1290:1019-1327(-)|eukprot:4364655-Ditylum_brightwellii.AAC.1
MFINCSEKKEKASPWTPQRYAAIVQTIFGAKSDLFPPHHAGREVSLCVITNAGSNESPHLLAQHLLAQHYGRHNPGCHIVNSPNVLLPYELVHGDPSPQMED